MPKNRTLLVAAIAALVCAHPPLAHAQQVRVILANGDRTPMELHFYVGTGDNYYLMNAVYAAQEAFGQLSGPAADFEYGYGSRAEHCFNGDQTRPNAEARLRYHQMFIPRIIEQMRKRAPASADTVSWRY